MSYVNTAKLKGNLDTTIPFSTSTFPFTTSQLRTDCIAQFGAYSKTFRIVNQDPTNQLTYRQGAPDSTLKPVPPNSEVIVEGWESYIEINPNAATGNGFLEIDLVPYKEAQK